MALRGQGINARVIDAGVSGDTSAAARQRIAFVLDNLDQGIGKVLEALERSGDWTRPDRRDHGW